MLKRIYNYLDFRISITTDFDVGVLHLLAVDEIGTSEVTHNPEFKVVKFDLLKLLAGLLPFQNNLKKI